MFPNVIESSSTSISFGLEEKARRSASTSSIPCDCQWDSNDGIRDGTGSVSMMTLLGAILCGCREM